jgi:hypothetical protein
MTLDDLLGMTDDQILALDEEVLLTATVEFFHRFGPPPPGVQELCMRTVQDVINGPPAEPVNP